MPWSAHKCSDSQSGLWLSHALMLSESVLKEPFSKISTTASSTRYCHRPNSHESDT